MSGLPLPTIEASLTFIVRSDEKPRVFMSANHAEANKRTGEFRSVRVTFRMLADYRSLQLGPRGFCPCPSRDEGLGFLRRESHRELYYPEVVELLKQVTGATEVQSSTTHCGSRTRPSVGLTEHACQCPSCTTTTRSDPGRNVCATCSRPKRRNASLPTALPWSMSGGRLAPRPNAFRLPQPTAVRCRRPTISRRPRLPGPHRRDLSERPF